MITIYAWVVALLSLPLMLLTCHMELKKLILLTVGVFAALLLWEAAAVTLPTMILAAMAVGTVATLYNILFQAELLRVVSGAASTVAMSIYSGIFNLGIGSETWLGSLATGSGHLAHIGYIGAAIAAAALLLCWFRYLPIIRSERA